MLARRTVTVGIDRFFGGACWFRATPVLHKDKPNQTSKGEPRRSMFKAFDEVGNEIKPEKKARTPDEKEKLDAARTEREARKKENRAKQLEIQRKRAEREAAKKKPGAG